MPPSSKKPVVELKFDPDDYLCTWHVPGLDGTTLHLSGSIDVRPDRSPRGIIYGKVPLESSSSNGETRFDLPQVREYKALRLTLANGGEGVLIDAQVSWMMSDGLVSGAAALLSKVGSLMPWKDGGTVAATDDDEFLYERLQVQVGGLDSVMGVAPIRKKFHPTKPDGEGKFTWTAESNPAAKLVWEADGDTLKSWYSLKVNTFDFYNVGIRFAPLAEATPSSSSTLFDLVSSWVNPLRGICSIATGSSQAITFLALALAGSSGQRLAQVFGTALMQDPFDTGSERVRSESSVLRCGKDGVSLLDLIHAWRRLEEEHHPLIETYADMLHAKDRHPRSRFLLLVQSIEGMHGHETKDAYAERLLDHKVRRDELLEAVVGHLSKKQSAFLKRTLSKEPPRGLEDALTSAFELPGEFEATREALEKSTLVTELVDEQGCTPLGALRIARNALAHGTRAFDLEALNQVNQILERVVRAHALRLLGCPPEVQARLAADPND